MSAKAKKAPNDPSRFEGNGISYKAKLIGIEDVPEARGDQMCQEAITKLKNSVKISGEHKRKIFVNVTLEGLKIIDAISLTSNQNKKKNEPKSPKPGEENETADKEQEGIVLHTHAVHRISFISRDTTDNRAFGYIYGGEDGKHQFFAIKTAAASEQLVLALRDLFQVVYEMKKKEMDEAKEKLEKGEIDTTPQTENSLTPGNGSTSGTGQTPQAKANADQEGIYQVPSNNAPVNPGTQAEQVANLLDLEDQAEHILKGIEQIKNLEFDSMESETKSPVVSPPTSPLAKLSPPSSASPSTNDPWGFAAPAATASTAAPASSALGDLAGLQTGPFPTMGQQAFPQTSFPQTSFPQTSFPMQGAFGAQPGFNMMSGGLPVTNDPFGNDPFGAPGQQPQMQGGFGAANPFGAGFNQPMGMQGMRPGMAAPGMAAPGMAAPGMAAPGMGMMPGMVPHGMVSPQGMVGMRNPFGAQQSAAPQMANPFGGDDPNLLKPMKKDEGEDPNAAQEAAKAKKSPRADLFGDLVDIKKSASGEAKSPKDLFAQISASEKKSMNDLKKAAVAPPAQSPPAQASENTSDPFGDSSAIVIDKTRGLLSDSGEEDPFDTSHIPPSLAEPPTPPPNIVLSPSASSSPPPVPLRHPSSTVSEEASTSSPLMPSSPPPPAPSLPPPSNPPLPSRSTNKPKTLKDSNENCSVLPPSDLNLSNPSSSNISFMLPSPDEPPPPLPSHLSLTTSSSIAPPPPPPRPKSNIKTSTLPTLPARPAGLKASPKKSVDTITDEPVHSTSSSPRLHDLHCPSTDSSTESHTSDIVNDHTQPVSVSGDAKPNPCDITSPVDPFDLQTSVSEDNLEKRNHVSKNNINSSSEKDLSKKPKSNTFGWVDFEKTEPNEEKLFGSLHTKSLPAEENDPFNMPVHLTPGFKAVAKYGNDPFDDTLNGSFNSSQEKWDPFGSGDNSLSQESDEKFEASPFGGDAFGAQPQSQPTSQPQPVNGNVSDNSLLD